MSEIDTYSPRAALKEKLVVLSGMQGKGYAEYVGDNLPEGYEVSTSFIKQVFAGRKPAPIRLMDALIRLAEGNPDLTTEQTWNKRHKWFARRGGEEE